MDSFANKPSREGAQNHSKRIIQKDNIQRQIETKRNKFKKNDSAPLSRRQSAFLRDSNNISIKADGNKTLADAYVKHFGMSKSNML